MSNEIYNIDHEHSFEFLHATVSVEDFSLNLLSPIINKINLTTDAVRNKLSQLLNRYDYIQYVDINKRKLTKILDRYNYMDLREIQIYKPIGLKGHYIDLLQTIEDFQSDLIDIDGRVLTPFLKWTGEVLNSPEKLKRLNVNQYFEFLDTKTIINELDNLFNPEDTTDTVNFGDLFQSNVQVFDVIQKMNDSIKLQNILPAKKLLAKVDTVAKRSEMLVRRCSVDKASALCSPASKKVMADVLYDIGTEITLYSRICYILISTQVAITDSVEKLLDLK